MPGIEDSLRIDYSSLLPRLGLDQQKIAHILAAAEHSQQTIAYIREHLHGLSTSHPGFSAFVLGSYGRLEASASSDFDLACIYDATHVSEQEAQQLYLQTVASIRQLGLDVAEKTFHRPIDLEQLVHNLGGPNDCNLHLTYRALLLTESIALSSQASATQVWQRLFFAYQRNKTGFTSLNERSLNHDLQRYYRTICMDFRYKVEEAGKAWLIRYIKLHHARKLWHFANLLLHAHKPINPPLSLLNAPPLWRIATLLPQLGADEFCADLFCIYERFLQSMACKTTRLQLHDLAAHGWKNAPVFTELHTNAEQFAHTLQAIFYKIWPHHSESLIRFGLF